MGGLSKRVKYPIEVTPALQQEFEQAEALYRQRAFEPAFQAYKAFTIRHPYNRLTDEAHYKMGKIFFLNRQYLESHGQFAFLAKKTPDLVYRAKGWLMAASASFQMNEHRQALAALSSGRVEGLPSKLKVQYYSLVILSSEKSGEMGHFGGESQMRLYDLYHEEGTDAHALRVISGSDIVDYGKSQLYMDAFITRPLTSAAIPAWMRRYAKNTPSRGYIDYKIAKIAYEESDTKKARQLFTRFLHNHPKNPYAEAAEQLLVKLGGPERDLPIKHSDMRVGLVLPLSGPFSSYGQEVIEGVRCASGYLNLCGPDSGVELVVKDSGLSPAMVNVAIQELVDARVSAIIGPMSASLAEAAAVTASSQQIPIFPITQKTGLMSQGTYVFQVGMTTEQQVAELVSVARGRGMKRFAIFYPDNEYGITHATLFGNEVSARGGEVAAKVSYQKAAMDLYAEAKKLKSSTGEFIPGQKPPIDAIFIPDSFRMINTLVGALEYVGISGVPLLGTNAWNDPGLSLGIATKFPGSFFVDMYDAASPNAANQDFRAGFMRGFGRSPTILSALGFDTMKMLLKVGGQKGGGRIQEALAGRVGYQGVTSLRGFHIGREPIVEPKVLKITETGIQE
jgi:ABC-type branched-subunit amino acid transport system substrate-binding protein